LPASTFSIVSTEAWHREHRRLGTGAACRRKTQKRRAPRGASRPRIGTAQRLAAHRVHHASNPEYIDKNFGGVLLISDHLFGTYQVERPDIKIRYGFIHPRSSDMNPFVIAYEDFWRLIKEVWNTPGWTARLRGLLGPP
jgi:hypothetical protein